MNAQASGQFFISIRLTTQFGITLEINLLLFSFVWNKGVGFYYFLGFIVGCLNREHVGAALHGGGFLLKGGIFIKIYYLI